MHLDVVNEVVNSIEDYCCVRARDILPIAVRSLNADRRYSRNIEVVNALRTLLRASIVRKKMFIFLSAALDDSLQIIGVNVLLIPSFIPPSFDLLHRAAPSPESVSR
jgi:hypothetical protein